MNIYELYGRQAEKLMELQQYHQLTQQVLNDLVAGKVLPAQLVVTQMGWQVADDPRQPSEEPERSPRRNGISAVPSGLSSKEGPGE